MTRDQARKQAKALLFANPTPQKLQKAITDLIMAHHEEVEELTENQAYAVEAAYQDGYEDGYAEAVAEEYCG